MYRGLSAIAIVPVFNEEAKIGKVIERMPVEVVDEIVVVDDGSTDRSAEVARALGANLIPMGATLGVGAALLAGYCYAIKRGYDVAVTVAGNNKDAPEEIPLLLDPIVENRADFVQGSRFLKRGASFASMPLYRQIATRLHPMLFSLVARRWVTESTNGFRAVRTSVLADPRLNLSQTWLRQYRARTVPVLAEHPAWVPHRGSPGDENLSAQTSGTDKNETNRRLVVDSATACVRGFRLAKVSRVDTTRKPSLMSQGKDKGACRNTARTTWKRLTASLPMSAWGEPSRYSASPTSTAAQWEMSRASVVSLRFRRTRPSAPAAKFPVTHSFAKASPSKTTYSLAITSASSTICSRARACRTEPCKRTPTGR